MNLGLYIHLPYCSHHCVYCDFNVYSLKQKRELDQYLSVILKEIDFYAQKFHDRITDTIYLGGGTPSLFSVDQIERLLSAVYSKFQMAALTEITIEANPASALLSKLKGFRSLGINRLSLGVQTFQSHHLRTLERSHSVSQAVKSFESARQAGFETINVDLIFGIPDQSLGELNEDLDQLFLLEPEHASIYHLTVDKFNRLSPNLPSDELTAQMYTFIIERMADAGYKHYEVSAFAREGFLCRHHLKYWRLEDYLGLGAGAYSYFRDGDHSWGISFKNVDSWEGYSSRIEKEGKAQEDFEKVTLEKAKTDYLIAHLRFLEGISYSDYEGRFGENIMISYGYKINSLMEGQLLDSSHGMLKLTKKGLLYLNQVLLKLL